MKDTVNDKFLDPKESWTLSCGDVNGPVASGKDFRVSTPPASAKRKVDSQCGASQTGTLHRPHTPKRPKLGVSSEAVIDP